MSFTSQYNAKRELQGKAKPATKILVTGGAGFIGSHLVDALVAKGEEVVVLDDLSSGRLANLHRWRDQPAVRLIKGSVLDQKTVREAIAGCDVVYHLAAIVGVKRVVEDPLRGLHVNVLGAELVFQAAQEAGAKVVFASSSEVYGKSPQVPFHEEGDRLLGATAVARWSYSTAKAVGEHLALAYARAGMPAVILRYFNAFGPRMDRDGYGGVIARFLQQAQTGEPLTIYGDGTQTRSFTYIDDVVRGTLLATERPQAEGQVLNLGSDREVTIRQLAELVCVVVGNHSPMTYVPYRDAYGEDFEDVPRRVPDLNRARTLLDFTPKVSLEEGLRLTWQWILGEADAY